MEVKLLLSVIPKHLKHTKFQDLVKTDYDFSKRFVVGKIHKNWPLVARNKPGCLLKCLITEVTLDGTCSQEKLTVYFYDKFAKEVHPLSNGMYIAFTGFIREALTTFNPSKELLPCQLLLRPLEEKVENSMKPEIWVLRNKTDPSEEASSESLLNKVLQSKKDFPVSTTSPVKTSVQSSPVKPTKSRKYHYTKLGEVKENCDQKIKYNAFGLVVTCEMKTSSNQRPYMNLTISDETCEKFMCIILGKHEDTFPDICYGDIVRIHRMQVNEYRNIMQGKCFSPNDVVVFKDSSDSPYEPFTSASTYTYSNDDEKIVEELRKWKRENDYRTFSQLKFGNYANILCQVASVSIISADTVILKVWDGTEPTCVIESFPGQTENKIECSELLQLVASFLVDIRLYDCHAKESMNIKPEQFIELYNVHLLSSTCRRGAVLCMHSGRDYNRHVSVLTDDSPLIQPLKKKLEDILKNNRSTKEQVNGNDKELITVKAKMQNKQIYKNDFEECAMDVDFSDTEILQRVESPVRKNVIDDDGDRDIILKEGNVTEDEGMDITLEEKPDAVKLIKLPLQKEKWWIHIDAVTDHDHVDIDPTFIQNVLKHEVPYKFRIFASITEIWPSVEKVRNFVYVYCPICDFLSSEMEMTRNNVYGNDPTYYCPNCSRKSIEDQPGTSSSTFVLEYTILTQFLLQDGTAKLKAFLWKENAIEFFREIQPEHLLNEDSIEAQSFREILWHLCPNIKSPSTNHNSCKPHPVIDCCIFSYTTGSEVNYQIFDTRVS